MNSTIRKIENILKSEYSVENFTGFICEILPTVKIIAPNKLNMEHANFSSHIEGSCHVGNYEDPNGKKIIIHSVKLVKELFVENSRSTQRNYAKKLIEAGNADAAIIAFYTEGEVRWRISFVRLDYEIKMEKNGLKISEKLTPAKRYSYLVGKDEPCHTAISRFHRFLVDDTNTILPTIDDLEDIFSVEKVTDEFFKLYCEKFHQLREALERNQEFIIEAQQHDFTSAQFAKKLMGQIVFLYFLQKKGWLGVSAWPTMLNAEDYKKACHAKGSKSRELIPKVYIQVSESEYHISSEALDKLSSDDEIVLASCVEGQPWGTGCRTFMRHLFELSQKKNANFFDDYLEPLFYNALNEDRSAQGEFDPALHCRIPFLSGGLFEPIGGYDWKHNNFSVPNEIFSNRDSENNRDGDGILDIFDRYNFTMSEDEPMEREVAIDPEMLGKVFENLLEVRDRKSIGAYYTPREIVHYMCQETLINYLVSETGLKEKSIRDFILYGDLMRDEDTSADKNQKQSNMMISEEIYKIDSDGKVVVNRLNIIDKALKNIRIVDPAVGSGAFPLGMLNEIVRARQNISAYMAITMSPRQKKVMYSHDRSSYSLKRETIKNCIFAADIDPSAIDIARLRLWISLVIDDEINPDAQGFLEGNNKPTPLPNLECNIVCGDSLLDEFEGISLINGIEQQMDFNTLEYNDLLSELIEKQNSLYDCENLSQKKKLEKHIKDLKDELINIQMAGVSKEISEKYKRTKEQASSPFVLWQIDFAKVFHEKGGFDVVIGNPPYIELQKAIDEKGTKFGDLYINSGFETFEKRGDIYCLFYEKGYSLLRKKGILAFITSNKWMRAGYGEKLRKFFSEKTKPLKLIDFAGQKVFASATVDVNILIFCKEEGPVDTSACVIREKCMDNLSVYVEHNSANIQFSGGNSWTILSPVEQSIKKKIEAVGTPLKDWDINIYRGILTGCNEAFIIDGKKKDELIAADPKSAEIIRPILRGRDIKRYGYDFADLWLINSHNGIKAKGISPIDINDYPAIKKHLDQFYPKLAKRTDKGDTPYNLRSCAYMDDFSKQKIIYPETTQGAYFALDNLEYYADKTCFIMLCKNPEYMQATLSSKLFEYAYKRIFSSIELGIKGYQYNKQALCLLPIAKPNDIDNKIYNRIMTLVQNRLSCVEINDIIQIENELNKIICSIYDLNMEEINYIMGL